MGLWANAKKIVRVVGREVRGPMVEIDNQTLYPLLIKLREDQGTLYITIRSADKTDNKDGT